MRCYKAPGGVRAQVRRSRQGPGRRHKSPEALSTPRRRDLASPGIVGSIPVEPRQSQHAMVRPLPTIYTPIKAILHFLTKSQENPLPQIESMHFSGHGEPFGHNFQNRTVSPYPVANRCEFEGATKPLERSAHRCAGAGKGLVGGIRAPRPCRHHGGGIWPALASWDQSRPSQGSPNMPWYTPSLLYIPLYKRFCIF